jgi:hypothetical protein
MVESNFAINTFIALLVRSCNILYTSRFFFHAGKDGFIDYLEMPNVYIITTNSTAVLDKDIPIQMS